MYVLLSFVCPPPEKKSKKILGRPTVMVMAFICCKLCIKHTLGHEADYSVFQMRIIRINYSNVFQKQIIQIQIN